MNGIIQGTAQSLYILHDGAGISPELEKEIGALRATGQVSVHVSGSSRAIAVGIPFPVAVLVSMAKSIPNVREYGEEAVLKLVRELLEKTP